MSDIARDNKSVEPDFQYDVKFNKREFFTNPGKDRFIVEDSKQNGRKYERGKLGHLRQRDFPIVPSVSMKDVKEVDYNALKQWQTSQPQITDADFKRANQSVTVDDLLFTTGAATQSKDYATRNKNTQGSIVSIGRDLQMKQLLLKAITKQASLENIDATNQTIFNNVIQKYRSGATSVVANNEEERQEIQDRMLKYKVFSPEPLNEYNANLLENLKSKNEKLEKDIAEITSVLGRQEDYTAKFSNFIDCHNPVNKQAIEKEVDEYEENVIERNLSQLKSVDADMEKQDRIVTTSIIKNLEETTMLKKIYSEAEKQIDKKLLQTKIFDQNDKYKKISASAYINDFISLNNGR